MSKAAIVGKEIDEGGEDAAEASDEREFRRRYKLLLVLLPPEHVAYIQSARVHTRRKTDRLSVYEAI